MFVRSLRLVTLLCLVPAAVFAMNRDEEDKQPQSMVACASAQSQFEAQLENTPATQLEIAPETPVTPETQQVAIPHVPQLPAEIWRIILLFYCQ